MFAARIVRSFLIISFLLHSVLGTLEIEHTVKTIDDPDGSFLCGRKLYFSKDIKPMAHNALSKPSELVYTDVVPNFGDPGPRMMWPLPIKPNPNLEIRDQVVYYLVFGGLKLKFLGMVFKLHDFSFDRCMEGSAAGEIRSFTPENGGLRCETDIIPTRMVIKFAEGVRKISASQDHTLLGKYPIPYTGNIQFEGDAPYNVWPMTKMGEYQPNAGYHIILDKNFHIIAAFAIRKRKSYLQCEPIEDANIEPSVLVPPTPIAPGRFDAFRCGENQIITSKVLKDTRKFYDALRRKQKHRGQEYPKPYNGDLFENKYGPLYLWPLRKGPAAKNRRPSQQEPFLAVINKSSQIIGVVIKTKDGGYKLCQRVSGYDSPF